MLNRLFSSPSLYTRYLVNRSTESFRRMTGSESTVFRTFGRPRFSASLCHSSV